jgi:hypothetical protein
VGWFGHPIFPLGGGRPPQISLRPPPTPRAPGGGSATPNRLLAAERQNQVQVPLFEQIGGGVVGDVIVGQATLALVRSR